MLSTSNSRVPKRAVQHFSQRPVGFCRRPLSLPNELGAAHPPDQLLEMPGILTDRKFDDNGRAMKDQRTRCRVDMPPISSFHWPLTCSYTMMNLAASRRKNLRFTMTRLSSWSCKRTCWRRVSEWYDNSFPRLSIVLSKDRACCWIVLAQLARPVSVRTTAKRRETLAST